MGGYSLHAHLPADYRPGIDPGSRDWAVVPEGVNWSLLAVPLMQIGVRMVA